MNKRFWFAIFGGLAVATLVTGVILSGSAWADCGGVETNLINCENGESGIGAVLKLILNILSVGVGIFAVIGITISGVQYMSARDNEETVRKSKRRLLEIVIGVVAYVLLYAGLSWVLPGGVPDPDDLPVYEAPETPVSSDTSPSTTPSTSDKTDKTEEPNDKDTSGSTSGNKDNKKWVCRRVDVYGKQTESADYCEQKIGYTVKQFPLGKLSVRWPMVIIPGMSVVRDGTAWLGHHGYLHTYNKAAAEAGNYKYWKDGTPVYDICGNYKNQLKDGDLCYDNRVEGNNDGFYNGAAVTLSADPGNVDIYSSVNIDKAFYDNVNISSIATGVNHNLNYSYYLYTAGVPVASMFDTSNGGSVVITSVSAGASWKCRTIKMQVYNGVDAGPVANMSYIHLSSYYPVGEETMAAPQYGVNVGNGTVIGYVGTSDCAQGTGPHLHLSLHQSETVRYDLRTLLLNNIGKIGNTSNAISYDQVVRAHFYTLCMGSSNSNCYWTLYNKYKSGEWKNSGGSSGGVKKAGKALDDPATGVVFGA